jgi:hypothetical protein
VRWRGGDDAHHVGIGKSEVQFVIGEINFQEKECSDPSRLRNSYRDLRTVVDVIGMPDFGCTEKRRRQRDSTFILEY